MPVPERPTSDLLSLTRRHFLVRSARAAAGLTLAPALLTASGCQKRVQTVKVEAQGAGGPEAAPHVLTAGRFTAAPDGHEREVWGYNGQLPGPTLRAKEGEQLRIQVVNHLQVPTSVHWHGMHQPGTFRMDGVPDVSGPPIPAGKDFVYEF